MHTVVTDHVLNAGFQRDCVDVVNADAEPFGDFHCPLVVLDDIGVTTHDALVRRGRGLPLLIDRCGECEDDLGVGQFLEPGEDLSKGL